MSGKRGGNRGSAHSGSKARANLEWYAAMDKDREAAEAGATEAETTDNETPSGKMDAVEKGTDTD